MHYLFFYDKERDIDIFVGKKFQKYFQFFIFSTFIYQNMPEFFLFGKIEGALRAS